MKTNMKIFFIFLIIIFYLHYTNNKKYNEIKRYIFSNKEGFRQLENMLKDKSNNISNNKILKYDHFEDVLAVTEEELKLAAQKAHDDIEEEIEKENKERFGNVDNIKNEHFEDVLAVTEAELKLAAQNAHNNENNENNQNNNTTQSTPEPVLGCMDMTALNYNPSASVSDGKCKFT